MTNPFKLDLDIESTADFIPLLEKAEQEGEEANRAVEKMMAINANQRQANAEQFDKVINGIGKFSKTLSGHLETRRDNRDRILKNKSKRLIRKSGITLEALSAYNEYYKDHEEFTDNVSYLHAIAAKLESEGKGDEANEIRKLAGYDIVVLKEVLATNAAKNLGSNFLNWAQEPESFKMDGDRKISYGSAENSADLEILLNHYLDVKGLNDINAYDDKFLDAHFWPEVERQEAALKGEFSKNKLIEKQNARFKTNSDRLLAAAGTSTFGQVFLEITKTEGNYYEGGRSGARTALIDTAIQAYIDGDITLAQLNELPEFEFTPKGWEDKPEGKNTTTIGEYFKEFEGLDSKISDAQLKKEQAYENAQKAEGLRFIRSIEETLGDLNRPHTEEEVRQIRNAWNSDPTRAYNPTVKSFIDHLANNTLEDREDKDIIWHLNEDLKNGIGLDLQQINRISDVTLRQEWKKYYDQTVGKGEYYKQGLSFVKSAVGQRWSQTTGTDDEKSPEWKQTWINSQRRYKELYAGGIKIGLSPEKAADRAQTETSQAVIDKKLDELPNTSYANSYVTKLNTVSDAITKAKENGDEAVIEYLQTTQFSDELDIKSLEQWNSTGKGSIPRIYSHIGRMVGKDKWTIANWQYQLATGKELRKPKPIKELENKGLIEQRLYLWRTTGNRIKKADLLSKNADFNSSELVSHPQ
tara:strand:+ start:499 stop:2586 length:2088 start_codon:yes stop_codon:yes gene_type:complete